MTALGIVDLLDNVTSHMQELGLFESVNRSEPTVSPNSGIVCSIFPTRWAAIKSSGLNTTSTIVIFRIRIQTSGTQEPTDDIDSRLMTANDELMRALVGDFTLGGLVRAIDVLGSYGNPLSGDLGWIGPNADVRVVDVLLPLIVNDLWDQEA